MAYYKIGSVTVGSGGQASMLFSTIPSGYKHLFLFVSARTNHTGVNDGFFVRLNQNTSNYVARRLYGDGSATTTDTTGSVICAADGATASFFSSSQVIIPHYSGNKNKSFEVETLVPNNSSTALCSQLAVLWRDTSAVTSIALVPQVGSLFLQHSTATLYATN